MSTLVETRLENISAITTRVKSPEGPRYSKFQNLYRAIMLASALTASATYHKPTSVFADGSIPNCEFVDGFKIIEDAIPNIVGDCLVNEHHNPENGDGLQETTKGLLVWRKADNFTAFTDGYHTWVNGPFGIQERLNTETFPWEAKQTIATNPEPVKQEVSNVYGDLNKGFEIVTNATTFGDGVIKIAPRSPEAEAQFWAFLAEKMKDKIHNKPTRITIENLDNPMFASNNGWYFGYVDSNGMGTRVYNTRSFDSVTADGQHFNDTHIIFSQSLVDHMGILKGHWSPKFGILMALNTEMVFGIQGSSGYSIAPDIENLVDNIQPFTLLYGSANSSAPLVPVSDN